MGNSGEKWSGLVRSTCATTPWTTNNSYQLRPRKQIKRRRRRWQEQRVGALRTPAFVLPFEPRPAFDWNSFRRTGRQHQFTPEPKPTMYIVGIGVAGLAPAAARRINDIAPSTFDGWVFNFCLISGRGSFFRQLFSPAPTTTEPLASTTTGAVEPTPHDKYLHIHPCASSIGREGLCSGAQRKKGALTDASPFLAAIMEPIMSGTDVPTASTSTPITMALTPTMQATPVASAT